MTEPTERDLFFAQKICEVTTRDGFVPIRDIGAVIALARAEGWQAASHAWQKWLDTNIPDWDAMAGIDLTTLPKERK